MFPHFETCSFAKKSRDVTVLIRAFFRRQESGGYTEGMASLVNLTPLTLDTASLTEKQEKLFTLLASMRRVIVAYSGGTDSAYLAWAAHRILGDQAVAITADSASIPESHKRDAEAFAKQSGFRHEYIETREFDNPDYVKNDPNRCFHCKDELFTQLDSVGKARGVEHIVYGVNVDDLGDYRPGQRAAKLHDVEAPLVDAGLTKAEIRELSRLANLATWDRPASACLSSRIPYGTPVTIENVKTVETGEEAIRALGFRQFRVRFHGELVRLEIDKDELSRALTSEMAQAFVAIFKPLGFHYVTIDLEGYRQGSLNSVLKQ
jgi:pyridinium-3,5-biscarboxylic acid mononucleotide sulfurtransferase